MGCHPCFYTRFLSKSYFFIPFVFHHRNTVLGSNYVEFLFIWFPIIRIWSYVLPKISRLFLSFLIIVKQSWFLSMFVLSSFGFQTFGCHPMFYRFIVRSSYFQSLGSHPKLYLWLFICSLDLSSLGTHPRLYMVIVSSFGFQSLRSYPRFYPCLFVCCFCFSSLGRYPRLYLR